MKNALLKPFSQILKENPYLILKLPFVDNDVFLKMDKEKKKKANMTYKSWYDYTNKFSRMTYMLKRLKYGLK